MLKDAIDDFGGKESGDGLRRTWDSGEVDRGSCSHVGGAGGGENEEDGENGGKRGMSGEADPTTIPVRAISSPSDPRPSCAVA